MSTIMTTCAGCGKERPREFELVRVEISLNNEVFVCHGRGGPSRDCLRKARDRICPVCGKQGYGYQNTCMHPVMCSGCKADLARGIAAKQAAETPRQWTILNTNHFLGAYVNNWDLGKDFARALARACGGRTEREPGEHGGRYAPSYVSDGGYGNAPYPDAVVEVTDEQHEALCELSGMLSKIMAGIRRDSFKQGNDLLGSLVRGEKTIEDYADRVVKGEK